MSPHLATVIYGFAILGLFLLNWDRKARTSIALWIPVMWLLLAGSRNVGEWMQLGQPVGDESAYLEGNPLDRNVLSVLLALGLIALVQRRQRALALLKANTPILLFFAYCGISFLWSDHPDVSFKRWIRAVGDVVMVLVVLADRNWMAALKRLFARVGYLLLPLSILFILYYPYIGRAYGRWDGKMVWTGVATGKNTLGMVCMIFGLAALWRVLDAWGKKGARQYGPLIANAVVIATAIFLLWKANSVTSMACFALGGVVMALTHGRRVARKPLLVHSLVGVVVAGAFCVLFLGIGSGLLENVGRDSTLTGRTDIWRLAISLSGNPLVGTGYESFWLGSRLEAVRRIYPNHVNQVHNGYLEIFLNLGWIGVILLAAVIVSGYRRITAAVQRQYYASELMLAYFVVGVVYNFTEGGFKMMYPVWIFFLLATMAVLEPLSVKVKAAAAKPRPEPAWAELPSVTTQASLEGA